LETKCKTHTQDFISLEVKVFGLQKTKETESYNQVTFSVGSVTWRREMTSLQNKCENKVMMINNCVRIRDTPYWSQYLGGGYKSIVVPNMMGHTARYSHYDFHRYVLQTRKFFLFSFSYTLQIPIGEQQCI